VLLDVEGTTTPLAFVSGRLFPYARTRLRQYLEAHGRSDDVARFLALMDQDSKTSELKELQGHIWEEGYRTGELTGEVFDDVPRALRRWQQQGVGVGVFSSGSVLAQKLLFRHSTAGDLTPLLRWHFDTAVGAKTDADSYARIAASIQMRPERITFISDVVGELDAARAAGLGTALSLRPGNAAQRQGHGHLSIRSFDELIDC
jgi:enolase-phosphatase E1